VNGAGVHTGPMRRIRIVVDGGEHHIVSDEHIVFDGDAALILDAHTGIEKDMLPDPQILAGCRCLMKADDSLDK